jgi:AcrR family transcriptional regulator
MAGDDDMAREPARDSARKSRASSARAKRAQAEGPSGDGPRATGDTDREKIIDAFRLLLAETRFERIGLTDIARESGLSLAAMRGEFSSTMGILAAHIKEIDKAVLAEDGSDMAEEPARERLFEVLMRRIEAMTPYKEATRSLLRSVRRNPPLAFAVNSLAVRSQQWMLTAAGIKAAGPMGMIRAQGLAVIFGRVIETWLDDDDEDVSRTMAALDRALARGERWAIVLDDVAHCLPPRLPRRRRRRRDDYEDDESYAA